jgi:hypothetical protein
MNPTQTIIEIDNQPVEIKARREQTGWAVIAFTPSMSSRSTKLHLTGTREAFARAIVYSILDPEFEDDWNDSKDALKAVDKAILYVTTNFSI